MNEDIKILVEQEPKNHVFKVGDTVKVHLKALAGGPTSGQIFEGIVIARKHGGANETFTVRKISSGIGVEQIFPYNSPRISKIEVVRKGNVRRAKLFYLRKLSGKKARVKEER